MTLTSGLPGGLRDQKKLETRARLARAAMDLVTERGYGQVTIADIADRAGVSRRTFSNYFASKAECLIEVNESEGEQILPSILSDTSPIGTGETPLSTRVAKAFAQLSDAFWQDAATMHRLRRDEPEIAAALARADQLHCDEVVQKVNALTDGQAELLRLKVAVAAVVAAINACLDHWLDHRSASEHPRELAALIEDTLTIVDLSSLDESYRQAQQKLLSSASAQPLTSATAL